MPGARPQATTTPATTTSATTTAASTTPAPALAESAAQREGEPTAPTSSHPLLIVGDPSAAACVGDFCEIPAHHDRIVVNRQLDDDRM